jgi:hypothetical protein
MVLGPPFARVLGEERKLTADEIDQEVFDIRTRIWPYDPALPMKNLYDRRMGCIFRSSGTIAPEVILEDKSTCAYDDLKALVEAGWVVD